MIFSLITIDYTLLIFFVRVINATEDVPVPVNYVLRFGQLK